MPLINSSSSLVVLWSWELVAVLRSCATWGLQLQLDAPNRPVSFSGSRPRKAPPRRGARREAPPAAVDVGEGVGAVKWAPPHVGARTHRQTTYCLATRARKTCTTSVFDSTRHQPPQISPLARSAGAAVLRRSALPRHARGGDRDRPLPAAAAVLRADGQPPRRLPHHRDALPRHARDAARLQPAPVHDNEA